MRMDVLDKSLATMPPPAGLFPFTYEDPLDQDAPDDEHMATTRRELLRLALIASETGARFQREGIAHDPMAWLLAPRRLFEGASAIDACLSRDACMRALLVHGLGLGLDADPEDVDALGDDEGEPHPDAERDADDASSDRLESPLSHRRLFTSMFIEERDGQKVYAFAAMIAADAEQAIRRLGERFGRDYATYAVVQEGFDAGSPLATTLLSAVIVDMLTQIATDPTSPLADGLEVMVEQRFAA
ncbi:hypothetical protein [Sphingomonas faeni]|uniref:hypothetical protein n=1 Tax=Sphingomonas faeni TaxID=185950 RepID=UPI00277FCA70|nr:hypothetical protein [Sphingomonas faeni]MDQ0839206.1 hypothetical protein [Sphingomonas faeni]